MARLMIARVLCATATATLVAEFMSDEPVDDIIIPNELGGGGGRKGRGSVVREKWGQTRRTH